MKLFADFEVTAAQMVLCVKGRYIVGALCGPAMTPEQREEYEERAGIMEYEGGMTRAEAEYQAMKIVKAKR